MELANCSKAQIIYSLQSNKVSKLDIESALSKQANTTATIANTVATKKQTLSEEDALAKQWLSIGGTEADTTATTANTAAKKANLSITNLLKVAYAKLKAVMIAHPLVAMASILGLVTTGVIKLSKWFENAGNRAKEAAEKSKEALDQTKSEIEQINSSLQTVQNRIDELNAKENLSLVESEELAKLKEANEELERELRIKEELAKTQGKEANDKAVKYFNTKTNHVEYSAGENGQMYVSDSNNYSLIDAVEKKLAKIPEMKQSLKDLQKQLEEIEDTDPNYNNNSDWLNLKGNINRMETELSNYQEFVESSIADFMEADDSLVEGIDNGILARLDSIYQSYDELMNGTAKSHENTISAILDKADFKKAKSELMELGKEGYLSVGTLASKFPELKQYLDEAGISAQELYQYIMNLANPDAVKYDELKRQLQDVMGFNSIFKLDNTNLDNQLNELGLYENDALEVFASIRAQYVNGETKTWTPQDWIANIQEKLNSSGEIEVEATISFEDALEKADNIQSSISTLRSALDSFNQGTLDESQVLDLMQQFPALIPYIDLAAEGFGNLSEGLSILIAQQPESLIQRLEALKSSLNTDEERAQVDALINSLQSLSSYGDTGMEAYATAIGSTWDDTANVIETVTNQFENLAKVQEAVADGLTMSTTAAVELAKMYPEILTNAVEAGNGQITLNEDVVNSILDGDESIINAQIAKLEADKAELMARKEAAIAELEIANQVGTAKGQIDEQTARNKIDLLNQELENEISKNNQVGQSYAQTAESMAQNTEQLGNYEAEVSDNMATNMNAASASMADGMATNSEASQYSLSGIAQKATDVANAVLGIATGKTIGNPNAIYKGKGGTNKGGIKTVSSPSKFTSTVSDYLKGDLSLDGLKSGLEIDISSYEKAVSNIDAQIDVLKNLQLTFDNNGGIGGHGYADKIKDLEKEKDKINSALDDAKGSSAEAKDEYEELFDFFERRIKVLDDALSLLKTNLDNVTGSFAKNKLVDAQLGITEEKFKNYSDALNMYTQKANEALSKLPSDIAAKIKDGAVDLTTFIGDGNKDVVEAIKDYEQWADKVADCKQELAELRTAIRQLELDKFNNIMEDFKNQFDLHEDGKGLISKQIDLLKEAGQLIGESFFTAQIDQSKKQLELLEAEKAQLVGQMNSAISSGRVQKGTEEWLSMVNALSDVEGNILDCKKAIEEFDNELLQLHWDIFDRIQGQFKDLDSELSNLRGLFEDSKVTDDSFNWSKESLAQLGLLAQQYELAQHRVQQYSDEINQLNKDYLNGKYSAMEYADKLSDLSSEQWEAVNATESIRDAIMDLNEARIDEEISAIEKEIDVYRELIDAQIDSLKSAKDLHDYQERIAEKTKSVTDLERQIVAMANDDSASAVAKKKQLQEQLVEAKKALETEQYDHSIEEQENALNKQYEQYEEERNAEIEALRASLEQKEQLIAESFEAVKQNANLIGQEIAAIATEHGVTVSNAIISSWQNGEMAIASYGTVLSAQTSAFIENIMGVEYEVYNLQAQANETANALAWMFSTRADTLVGELASSYYSEQNLNYMTQALRDSLVKTLEGGYNISGITSALDGIASGLNGVASAANNAANAIAAVGAAQASTPTYSSATSTANTDTMKIVRQNSGEIREVMQKDEDGKWHKYAYAKGTRNAKGGLRVINEKGQELTLPKLPSGNYAIGNDGDQILTKEQTDNVYEWSKVSPDEYEGNKDKPKLLTIEEFAAMHGVKPIDFSKLTLNAMYDVPSQVKQADISPETVNRNNTVNMHYDSLVTVNGDVNDADRIVNKMEKVAKKAVEKSWHDATMTLKYEMY